jgi:hypothetical protein
MKTSPTSRHGILVLSIILIANGDWGLAGEPGVAGEHQRGAVYSPLDHGLSASAADNTAAIQQAIDACQGAGGGIVQLPAGLFRVTGTLRMNSSHVWLRGPGRAAATLLFDNAGADCIVVGNRIPQRPPIARSEVRSNKITDLNIVFAKKTAGRTVAIINHFDFIMEKVTIDHCVVGVYAERTNNVVLRDVIIIPDNKGALDRPAVPWSSWVGVWWDTPPDPADSSARSDVLYFDNVSINCNDAPGTGVLWDGMTNTFLINYANILNGAYGFRVINSRHNKQYLVPQFLNAFALLLENARIAMSIETGCEFKITSSDMDMCKENTLQILPDLEGSPTDCVQITNSRIGNCQKTGIFVNARDVKIGGTQMFSTSLAGRNRFPVIEVGPDARDVSITDVRAEEHIGARRASHAVSIAAGASNVQIDNLDAAFVNAAAILNKGARNLTVGKVIEPGDARPSGIFHDGDATGFFAQRRPGLVRFLSRNWATGMASAAIGAATGTDQAELEIAVHDNSGKPFVRYRYGSAVDVAYENIAERVFGSPAGAERLRIGAAGLSASVPYVDRATSFVTPKQGGSITADARTSRLVLTPGEPIKALAIALPDSPVHGQLFHVSAVGQPVSGIRWPGNVVGAPSAIPKAHTIVFQFNADSGKWLCVEG